MYNMYIVIVIRGILECIIVNESVSFYILKCMLVYHGEGKCISV